MQAALDLWPACYWGFWAYPVTGIIFYRRRRLIRELAAIGTGRKASDFSTEEAFDLIRQLSVAFAEQEKRHG